MRVMAQTLMVTLNQVKLHQVLVQGVRRESTPTTTPISRERKFSKETRMT